MKLSPAFWLLLGAAVSCQVVLDLSDRHAAAGGAGGIGGDASAETGSGGSAGETSVAEAPVFALRFGDAKYQHVDGLVGDGNGDVSMFGRFDGELDFGNGVLLGGETDTTAAFLARFHSDGSIAWAKRASYATITSVAMAYDRTVAVGTFSVELDFGDGTTPGQTVSDLFLVMFESEGATKIVRTYPGSVNEPHLVALGERDVVMSGRFVNELDFAGTSTPLTTPEFETDSYVAKLDASGVGTWARSFPECSKLAPRAIARAANGTIALAAEFSESCKLDSIVLAAPPGLTSTDCLIATLDAESGDVSAAVRIGASHCDASSVSFTSDFGVAFLGSLLGTPSEYAGLAGSDQDVFALALSSDLTTPNQAVRLARTGSDSSTTLAVDVQDRLFAAGTFPSGTLVAQLVANGSGWSKEQGAPTPFENSHVVTDLSTITVAGTLKASADFGGGAVTPLGEGDAFLVKYVAPP